MKFKYYRRYMMNTQFLQVSGLCSLPFASYFPKLSKQIYKAQYGGAIFVSFRGTQIWLPWCLELNFDIIATSFGSWASILSHKQHLLYLKCSICWKWKGKAFFQTKQSRHSAWCHIRRGTQIFKMLCFKNEGHYWAENLQKDIFLVHLTTSDND